MKSSERPTPHASPAFVSWLCTTRHEQLALLSLVTILAVGAIGAIYAPLLGLRSPTDALLDGVDRSRARFVHAVLMVFVVVVPAIPSTLGQALLPTMIGARGFAFPRLGRAALRTFWAGASLVLLGALGLSTRARWHSLDVYSPAAEPVLLVVLAGMVLVALSAAMRGVDTLVTLHKLRAQGLGFRQLPVFAWASYAVAIIGVVAPAPLLVGMVLGASDRWLRIGVFDPALGGDPVLYQLFFWSYAHPTMFGAVLAALGVAAEILSVGVERPGGRFVGPLFVVLAVLSFTHGGIHLVGMGPSGWPSAVWSLLALLTLAPVVALLGWLLRGLRDAPGRFGPAKLFASSALIHLALWVATSAALSMLSLSSLLRDNAFETANLHFGLAGVTLTALLGGLVHGWPLLTGRGVHELRVSVGALGLFVGLLLGFVPRAMLGFATDSSLGPLGSGLSHLGAWLSVVSVAWVIGVLLLGLRMPSSEAPNPRLRSSRSWLRPAPSARPSKLPG